MATLPQQKKRYARGDLRKVQLYLDVDAFLALKMANAKSKTPLGEIVSNILRKELPRVVEATV